MAKMVPSVLYDNVVSPGEIELFQRLDAEPGTDGWVVFHSLNIARHASQVQGEADFVVVIPEKGVLVVEVKAVQRVRYEDGTWFLGQAPPTHRGPFKQADDNMRSLKTRFENFPSLKSVLLGKCVVFTDVEFGPNSTEWNEWEVIDKRKLSLQRTVGSLFTAVLDHWKNLLHEKYGFRNSEPSSEQITVIENLLRPEFEVFESPRSRLLRLNKDLKHYTEEQYGAIDAMSHNKRVVFEGPAGTGKTLLAIEAARRSAAKGRRVLFLCFNQLLGSWIKTETEPLISVKTTTLHGYLREVSETESIPENTDSKFWDDLTHRALGNLLEKQFEQFDELIIDEAQDILLNPIFLDVLDLSLVGGLSDGNWRAFGDFEKQAIYKRPDSFSLEDLLNTRLPNLFVYSLRNNCRNSPRIAELVHQLGGLNPGYRKILRKDDGNNPKQLYYSSIEQQLEILATELASLEENGFKRSEVVILSPKKSTDCAASKLHGHWKDRVRPFANTTSNQILFSSIHAFKGMEAQCIIVTDLENVSDDLFYIAITRTLHRLVLLISDDAKAEIQQLILQNLVR